MSDKEALFSPVSLLMTVRMDFMGPALPVTTSLAGLCLAKTSPNLSSTLMLVFVGCPLVFPFFITLVEFLEG